MSVFFPHLNNTQILELLNPINENNSEIQKYDEFNKLQFHFISSNSDSHNLESLDPESNLLRNVIIPNTTYYNHNNFEYLTLGHTCSLILMYNICSIPNNLEHFLIDSGIAHNHPTIDILSFCETRLSKDIEHLYNIKGYKLLTNNRNHYGGGVCMYIRDIFPCRRLQDVCLMNDDIESLCIETTYMKKKMYLGIIYRRPNGNINSFITLLEDLLLKISLAGVTCVLQGDININLLNKSDKNTKEYIDLMASFGFYPYINKPTRVNRQSSTLIDHIWCNNPDIVLEGGILMSDVSDHFAPFLMCKGQSPVKKELTLTYRNYKNIDQATLSQNMQTSLMSITFDNNPNDSLQKVINTIDDVINDVIPLKTVKIRDKKMNKPWINSAMLVHIKERHKLYKKYLKKPISFGNVYREYRNKVNNMLKDAKNNYYKSKFRENAGNSKGTWNVINEIINKKDRTSNNIEFLNINHVDVKDPDKICNHLNCYFATIGSNLAKALPTTNVSPTNYLTNNYPDFRLLDTSPAEITNIIKSLKDSAPGLDGIHIKVLKLTATLVSPYISKLINLSFHTGIFPSHLKVAKVIPIFKGGNQGDVSNYRPISILTSIGKIFESAMYNRLIEFLDCNNILKDCQFGFRKNFSPKLAVTQLVERILQAQGDGKFSFSVFLDLRKAFDTLDHDILLKKLRHYGIRNVGNAWFRSYLSDRSQYTVINNITSKRSSLNIGVPQGSTLGPLLFLLYINDIPNSTDILKFTLFADDTCITHSHSDIVILSRTLNSELESVSTWLLANKLSLNLQKTQYMVFAGNKPYLADFNVAICGQLIQRTHCTKYLGIFIDDRLVWRAHINHIVSKLSKSLGILHKVKHMLTTDILITLYYTMFYPYLHYCTVTWGMANKTALKTLTLLQKRIIRTVAQVNYREHTAELFKRFGILKIHDVYLLECLKFVYQQSKKNLFIFTRASDVHGRNTRSNHLLRPMLIKTEAQKRFVMYYGCNKWNELPNHIKTCNNKDMFKMKCKQYILNGY